MARRVRRAAAPLRPSGPPPGKPGSYPSFLEGVPFDPNDVDRVCQTEAGGHAYRGITFPLEEAERTYLQVLVNVDAELAILDGFTRTLVLYLAAVVVAAAAASYLLSRRTLKPIVQNWKAQTEFVQNASHELRTPLAIILAAQERLLAEPGARIVDRFEDVGAVADETKRLARLVDDLMTLTSADASTEDEREAAPLEVGGIVEDVAGLYADVAEVAGKTLTVAVRPAGEVRIEADALRQVLGILLDNALKYTVAGDSVAVRCEERGARVTLSVADTGCGIDPADRGRVFERFYRADTARTTPGSGLGLSIARALVEHAGGVVAIEANEPRGTCVTVVLPKARAR
ncbi:sensor histidine kinase [Gordonibacter pamelaeae]|uniref:sensor histidine kinase n=1 Tax=Gordonibacter pamelaeae TaxID=471189 RepID=UPI003A8E5C11